MHVDDDINSHQMNVHFLTIYEYYYMKSRYSYLGETFESVVASTGPDKNVQAVRGTRGEKVTATNYKSVRLSIIF